MSSSSTTPAGASDAAVAIERGSGGGGRRTHRPPSSSHQQQQQQQQNSPSTGGGGGGGRRAKFTLGLPPGSGSGPSQMQQQQQQYTNEGAELEEISIVSSASAGSPHPLHLQGGQITYGTAGSSLTNGPRVVPGTTIPHFLPSPSFKQKINFPKEIRWQLN